MKEASVPSITESVDAAMPRPGTSRRLRVAIFGFGTVGRSVARILVESAPEGLELTHIVNRKIARKRVDWVPGSVIWSEDAEAVLSGHQSKNAGASAAPGPDIVVELAGGLKPAGDWVRKALAAGKSVVTANKKLIAFHGWSSRPWRPSTAGICFTAQRWRAAFQ